MLGKIVQISHLSFRNNKESVPFFTLSNNMLPFFKIVLKRQGQSFSCPPRYNLKLVRNRYCTDLTDWIKCKKIIREKNGKWKVYITHSNTHHFKTINNFG